MALGLYLSALMVGCERALHHLIGISIPPDHPAWKPLDLMSKISLIGCATLITMLTGLEVTMLALRSIWESFSQMRNQRKE